MSGQESSMREAPKLCWGSSPTELDVGFSDACEYFVHFKRLKQLSSFDVVDDKHKWRSVKVYYYEDPIFDEQQPRPEQPSTIPPSGIVVSESTVYENENGRWTQVITTLRFLPITYKLA